MSLSTLPQIGVRAKVGLPLAGVQSGGAGSAISSVYDDVGEVYAQTMTSSSVSFSLNPPAVLDSNFFCLIGVTLNTGNTLPNYSICVPNLNGYSQVTATATNSPAAYTVALLSKDGTILVNNNSSFNVTVSAVYYKLKTLKVIHSENLTTGNNSFAKKAGNAPFLFLGVYADSVSAGGSFVNRYLPSGIGANSFSWGAVGDRGGWLARAVSSQAYECNKTGYFFKSEFG